MGLSRQRAGRGGMAGVRSGAAAGAIRPAGGRETADSEDHEPPVWIGDRRSPTSVDGSRAGRRLGYRSGRGRDHGAERQAADQRLRPGGGSGGVSSGGGSGSRRVPTGRNRAGPLRQRDQDLFQLPGSMSRRPPASRAPRLHASMMRARPPKRAVSSNFSASGSGRARAEPKKTMISSTRSRSKRQSGSRYWARDAQGPGGGTGDEIDVAVGFCGLIPRIHPSDPGTKSRQQPVGYLVQSTARR